MFRRFVMHENEEEAFALLSARPGAVVNDNEIYFYAGELCLAKEWGLPKKFIFVLHSIAFQEGENPDPLRFHLDWDDTRNRMEEMGIAPDEWTVLRQAVASAAEKLHGTVTFDEDGRFVLFDVDGIDDFTLGSFLEEIASQKYVAEII